MSIGYIYVLSNASMPGVVKIGKSKHGAIHRAKQLFTTSVPTPFDIEFEMLVDDIDAFEKDIHQVLSRYRVLDSREFFNCHPDSAEDAIISNYLSTVGMGAYPSDLIIDNNEVHKLAKKLPPKYLDNHQIAWEIIPAIKDFLKPDHLAEAIDAYRDSLIGKAGLDAFIERRRRELIDE